MGPGVPTGAASGELVAAGTAVGVDPPGDGVTAGVEPPDCCVGADVGAVNGAGVA